MSRAAKAPAAMTTRIFRSIFLVAMAVLLLVVLVISGILYQYFSDRDRTQLRSDLALAAAGMQTGGDDYLHAMDTASDTRLTLIAADGTVLFDSSADAAALENHADRAEVREALAAGRGESTRYSKTLAQRTNYAAQRLPDGTVLRLARTHTSLWALLLAMLQPLVLLVIAACALSAMLAGKLAHNIVRPINALNLEQPGKGTVYPELAPLMTRLSLQNGQINAQISELRRKQQEFASITENMQEGFLILDSHANLLSYNSSALHLLDAEAPTAGLNLLSISDSAVLREAVQQAFQGQRCEAPLPHAGRHYRLIASPVWQEDEVLGAVLILLDETEKEQREQLRREFTANVSHELKTPLTSISGFAEIIKSGMVRSEDISRFAANIYDEAQRLITLVGDIIKLSQMDENSVPVERQPVDLFELAQSVVQRLGSAAAKQRITLAVSGTHCVVQGVPQILDEMVTNLCDNAVKYNHAGGSVTISVLEKPNGVLFSVADTGIGISAGDRDRVFERFYRVDKSHSKQIGGTGLGLSIVKHGAAYHGAQLSLESEPDCGTIVSLLFPPPTDAHAQEHTQRFS